MTNANRFTDWTIETVQVRPAPARANPNHDQKGEFATGSSAGTKQPKANTSKSALAKENYKPSTAAKQRKGEAEQAKLATTLHIDGLNNTQDNAPFDLLSMKARIGVEVKTLIDNDNDKITVHPESRRRKEAFADANHLSMHVVAIDTRHGERQYYYHAGVGAFRLSSMERVTVPELRMRLTGGAV